MKALYNIDGAHEELELRACRDRDRDVCSELGLVSSCRVKWCEGSLCNNGTEYVIEDTDPLQKDEPRRFKKVEMFFIVVVPTILVFLLIAIVIYICYR